MKSEIDAILDDLLVCWFGWRQRYRFARGFAGQDMTCRDYRTPGHWDWKNGAEEERAEELRLKAFDEAIERVPNEPQRWRTALEFEARNLSSGSAVWTSPVLPKTREEREVLVLEARNRLLLQLRRQGMIG